MLRAGVLRPDAHRDLLSLCGAAAVATGVLVMRSTVLYRREVLLAVELEGGIHGIGYGFIANVQLSF